MTVFPRGGICFDGNIYCGKRKHFGLCFCKIREGERREKCQERGINLKHDSL